MALIDEFQDTDPVQYRIFSRLYRAPQSDPATTALLMIGDPKQAIYAFRGADIHTYLRARRATPSRFTLLRNFRSTESMVAATNALFAGHPEPFGSAEIPFVAVDASAKSTHLVTQEGVPVAALGAWWPDSERYAQGDYQARMATATRAEVQRLLEGAWRFTGEHGERTLKPADIAILVRNGPEALKVRRRWPRAAFAVSISASAPACSTPRRRSSCCSCSKRWRSRVRMPGSRPHSPRGCSTTAPRRWRRCSPTSWPGSARSSASATITGCGSGAACCRCCAR
ncbi:UvrD-helicase domain-containing protein [Salinicola tamaricis]|uniref:UvrD-helicase domain-containing protein n=1 Tax=Salinicola tamaricis TaxID=1771309 RepID=UPI0013ECC065|nr:UvrD-helicase domain-containing protein [Salinicola tamaricis]